MRDRARYQIYFYRTVDEKCQACDYARAMDIHHQAKAKRWFKALSELGPEMPAEYAKPLRDGIWELRIVVQHHQHRFLYAFWKDTIIVTNAFLKRSRKAPEEEIEKARKSMTDWMSRWSREGL